ncbi:MULTISPECIES: DUF1651 domain-containing protein [Prochlorococcus]|uniref:DUF1651 domain-containing protein n=1 Tax=Prochlorococcus TaxID=1218 RepID=UPI0005339C65|nr:MULTISPECIES: DUF1651 domain-containing protein [Prochlorococcus]KGG12741.1 hypothetical protein EV05_1959 [Prochlorococcus sp. MIT 0601]
MIPNGWLIDPKGKCLLLFQKEPMGLKGSPKIFMDKWDSTSQGTPSKFRNRRKVDIQPAIETWNELIGNGWRHLQFHDLVA